MAEDQTFRGSVLVTQGLHLIKILNGSNVAEKLGALHLLSQDKVLNMLKGGLFFMEYDKFPERLQDVQTPELHERAAKFVVKVKTDLVINSVFNAPVAQVVDQRLTSSPYLSNNMSQNYQDAHRKLQEQKALRDRLAKTNKPDPMGTVGELAKKFNKSKSEIRRLKAEGLLHTLEAPSP